MYSLTLNVENESLMQKVIWMLEHFKSDGLEILIDEDEKDLNLIKQTRHEESISFEEYLKNENKY
jgi:hypothetical protein